MLNINLLTAAEESSIVAYRCATAALELATSHAGSNDSAVLCANDARQCIPAARYLDSIGRSIKSIQHSQGVFSAAYKQALALQEKAMLAL